MTWQYFYAPRTCSVAAMVALDHVGADFEPVAVSLAGDRAALKAVYPVGKVPALLADGLVVSDTLAIIYWLSQRFPHAGLLPSSPDALSQALSVMAWMGSTMHITRRRHAFPGFFTPDPSSQQSVRDAAAPAYWRDLSRIDSWLQDANASNTMSSMGVQAYALVFYMWGMIDGQPMADLKAFSAMAERLAKQPAVARSLALHNGTWTAAAS